MSPVRNFGNQANKISISNGVRIQNLRVGQLGEVIAKRYLQKKSYRIIEQNYRTKYAEIDLIARSKDILVFIEVRTRKDEQLGTPEESIKKGKIRRLIRNAEAYAARMSYTGKSRIDAICIVLDQKKDPRRISHYENITL